MFRTANYVDVLERYVRLWKGIIMLEIDGIIPFFYIIITPYWFIKNLGAQSATVA